MLDRVIFFTLLPYFYDILDIIKYDCSRKSAKEILFMNKENRKAAKERRAKEREHEAKVAHYKKIWSWAGPALIVVVIGGLIIASVLIDRIRLISLHFGFCLFADRHFPYHRGR